MKQIYKNNDYHLFYPPFILDNIGVFEFFKLAKFAKEFIPIPPKVNTGIFTSPYLWGLSILG